VAAGDSDTIVRVEDLILIRNAAEASLLDALLTEEGVPHFLKAYSGPAFDGLTTYKDSWGHVDAPAEYRQQIRALLEDLRASSGGEDSETVV
jgi:hypothetical protein